MIVNSALRARYVALLALPIVALAAAAQQPGIQASPKSPSFKAIGVYELTLDTEPVADASFYHSPGLNAILLETAELSVMVELQPRGQVLRTFPADAYHRNANGTLDRDPSAQPLTTGRFELDGALPRFTVEGRRAAVVQKPPLLGPQSAQAILDHDSTYADRARLYRPREEFLAPLRAVTKPVRVKVVFGSWCSVCAEFLPNILSVESALDGSNISFEYYGIPQDFGDPEAKRLGVTSLPTGIIYIDGKEADRVVGYGWRFPDMKLRNVLLRAGS